MAILKKPDDQYDTYNLQCSARELRTLQRLLAGTPGAESDELRGALDWYLDKLPPPGKTKEDMKALDAAAGVGPKDAFVEEPEGADSSHEELPDPDAPPGGSSRGGESRGPGRLSRTGEGETEDIPSKPYEGPPEEPENEELPEPGVR